MSIFSEHLQGCLEFCVLKFLLWTKLLASHFLVIYILFWISMSARCLNVMVCWTLTLTWPCFEWDPKYMIFISCIWPLYAYSVKFHYYYIDCSVVAADFLVLTRAISTCPIADCLVLVLNLYPNLAWHLYTLQFNSHCLRIIMSIMIASCVSDCRWLNLLVSKGTELQRILPRLIYTKC